MALTHYRTAHMGRVYINSVVFYGSQGTPVPLSYLYDTAVDAPIYSYIWVIVACVYMCLL